MKRVVLALSLATLCGVVLSQRVYVAFDRVRIRVVRTARAPVDGTILVELPDVSALVGRPATLTCEFASPGGAVRFASIRLNGLDIGQPSPLVARLGRVDLSLPGGFDRAAGNEISMVGVGAGTVVNSLEVGNAYGFSSGRLAMMFVPAAMRDYDAAPPWIAIVFWAGAFLVGWRGSWEGAGRRWRIVYWSAGTGALALLSAVAVLPIASPYKVLLSVEAFAWCVVALYGPLLATMVLQSRVAPSLGRFVVTRWRAAVRWRIHLLYLATVVLFLTSMAGAYDARTGFTSLILFGRDFNSRALPALRSTPHAMDGPGGYDGQWYAQLALDPLTRDPGIEDALDSFSYRARRILFSWTAWLLGAGRPEGVLQAYAWQNILCWLISAVVLVRWLPPRDLRRFFAWFGCLLGYGFVASVRYSLLEGPSLLLLLLAVWAVERGRTRLATAIVAVSGLGRETNLLGVVALWRGLPRRWGSVVRLAIQGAIVVLPLAAWLFLLQRWHPAAERDVAGIRNFAPPLQAYAWAWADAVKAIRTEGWTSYSTLGLLAYFGVGIQLIWLLTPKAWPSPWHRVGVAYALLMAVLGPAVWYGYPGAYARVLLPMTVAFNVGIVHERSFWPLAVAGNLTILMGLKMMQVF